ncbi:predicted protein [Plenodomus lingam JN3]|uniref:Predicted protein n=1 Tax=Leptosphaeria maculans (strain JN3 / isolate v23.1.3 / race Av1-4-5-6-7-8) TaxID=985895 RepID=E5AC23_LEPMJ|nr:predicted protein [Plenodomus lingam JN3]CBY00134.1 predicted protein [Plenodomus lingam JN3]
MRSFYPLFIFALFTSPALSSALRSAPETIKEVSITPEIVPLNKRYSSRPSATVYT